MKTLFIAAGPETWGSSRLRCYWPARVMNAEVVPFGDAANRPPDPQVEAVIWQKNLELALFSRFPNARHYYDACDPTWWWQPDLVRGWLRSLAGVVCSSSALAADFSEWSGQPAVCIPDRLDLRHYGRVKRHQPAAPVRCLWYGVAFNRIALFGALANLERLAANGHKLALTVCDDRPEELLDVTDMFPVYHTRWRLDAEVDTLLAHDIALLPPYPGPWGRVKSNNKALSAWAAGLPVATGECYGELEALVTRSENRNRAGALGRAEVETNWRVEQSAAEWEQMLNGR